jgi:hypothetical protein
MAHQWMLVAGGGVSNTSLLIQAPGQSDTCENTTHATIDRFKIQGLWICNLIKTIYRRGVSESDFRSQSDRIRQSYIQSCTQIQ